MTMSTAFSQQRTLHVIITAYNRADFVARCLRSVLESATEDLRIHCFVMDNGSTDRTSEAAREAGGEHADIIRTEDNRSVVEVLNRGFDAARERGEADFLMCMNEDTEFMPGAIARLAAAADARPEALLTPLQLNYRAPDRLDDSAYLHVREARELIEAALLQRPFEIAYPVPTMIGAAMFARREVWAVLGEFDELFWFYGVDDDLCTRAHWLGYEVLVVPDARLLHAHGKLGGTGDTPVFSFDKWRKELQARYMFVLKRPGADILGNLLRGAGLALQTAGACLLKGWPQGTWGALEVFGRTAARWREIEEARKRHFDPAKRRTRVGEASR